MNLLDDLFYQANQDFQAAALQKKKEDISIKIVLIWGHVNFNWSAVMYAEGTLYYHAPAALKGYAAPPFFASKPKSDLKLYYSQERGLGSTPLDVSSPLPPGPPFDHTPGKTSEVSAAIRTPVFTSDGNYTISVHSSQYNWDFTSELISDDASGFFYGGFLNAFLTVGLSVKAYQSP